MSVLSKHIIRAFILYIASISQIGYAQSQYKQAQIHHNILPFMFYFSHSTLNYLFAKQSDLCMFGEKKIDRKYFEEKNIHRKEVKKEIPNGLQLVNAVEELMQKYKKFLEQEEFTLNPLVLLKILAKELAHLIGKGKNYEELYAKILEKMVESYQKKEDDLKQIVSQLIFSFSGNRSETKTDTAIPFLNTAKNAEIAEPYDPTSRIDSSPSTPVAQTTGQSTVYSPTDTARLVEEEEEAVPPIPKTRRLITYDVVCNTASDKSSKHTSKTKESLRVENLANFVEKVSTLAAEQKFEIVCIDGHGANNVQSIGGAGKDAGTSSNDLTLKYLPKQKKLLKQFRKDCLIEVKDEDLEEAEINIPIVALMGCSVATDLDTPSELLCELSNILHNTIVIGFSSEVASLKADTFIFFSSGHQTHSPRLSLARARIFLNGEEIDIDQLEAYTNKTYDDLEDLLFNWELQEKYQ